jgi:hypothetical protein
MNIPGFTAEASLHRSSSRYALAHHSVDRADREGISPQAKILDGFCIGNGSYCCFRGPDRRWSCGRTIST